MNGTPSGIDDLSLGELLVRQGFVTFNQVHECLLKQKSQHQEGRSSRLGEILLEHGYIRPDQLQLILDLQSKGRGAGRVVIPGYEILEKIGHGAMGAVYRARQLSVDRIVAIKVLSGQLSSDPQFVERFLREARAVAKLSHPNIVAGIDAGDIGGLHYYVMEYVEGTTAQALLRSRGRIPERECARIGLSISRALEHAGHNGIVHRDIKPQNIMVGRDDTVKLCDLGLAKKIGGTDPALTADGVAIGTPYYLSPELALGHHDVDIRSDLYSLGATLYHLATGQPPFHGSNYAAILAMHVHDRVVPPNQIAPELSENFSRIVLKCLEKRPEDRYTLPAHLATELELLLARAASSGKSGLRKPPPIERAATRLHTHGHTRVAVMPKRRTTPMLAILALILLAAGGLAFLASMRGSSSPRHGTAPDAPSAEPRVPAGDSYEKSEALFEKRREEYAKIRAESSVSQCYEFLLKNYVDFASTIRQPFWQQEIDRFEQETNEGILRLHWNSVAEKVDRLRAQGKLVAALEAVNAFPLEHRYFIRRDNQERLTAAGDRARKLADSISRQIDDLTMPILEAFDKALTADEYEKALSETDRLVPLAYSDLRQAYVDELRTTVLVEMINDALTPPLQPSSVARIREKVAAVFDRYRTNPKVASRIDPEIARFEEGYAQELERSAAQLAEIYEREFEQPFDRLLAARRYPEAKLLARRLFIDPAFAHVQTALAMSGFDRDLLVKQLAELRFNDPADYAPAVRRLEEGRAVANTRPEFKPLGRLLGDLRALYLLESLIERAASAIAAEPATDLKSLRQSETSGGRILELQRLPADDPARLAVFKIRLAGGGDREISLAPLKPDSPEPPDLISWARRAKGTSPDDQVLDLQAALLHLFCIPPREKEVHDCLARISDPGVRLGWDQYDRRLKTLTASGRADPPAPTAQSLFRGKMTVLDPKSGKVRIFYDFKNAKELDDFDAQRERLPGGRLVQTAVTGGVTLAGTGITFWKGVAQGSISVELVLTPNSSAKNLMISVAGSDRQSGYGLFLDCTLGNLDKDAKADHHMGLVRLPLAEKDPLLASNRFGAPLPGALVAGKQVHVKLTLADRSLRAEVKGVRGTASFPELAAQDLLMRPGSLALWVFGAEVKIHSIAIETVLDERWVKEQLAKPAPK